MKTIIISLFLLLLSLYGLAQTDSSDTLSGTSLPGKESGQSKHSLYAGLGYGNNMIYLGSTISGNQPFGYAAITYGFKDELFATVSPVYLSGMSPLISFYSGTVSWTHTFNSWFDMAANVSRYQVAPSLIDTLFNHFSYGNVTFGFDWKLIYTTISGGVLLSTENRGYLQVKNSRYFQTPEFSKKKLFFSFDPYFNMLFGTVTKVETVEGTTITLTPPFHSNGKHNQSGSGTKYTNIFSLMEIDLGIPVDFYTDRFTLEIEPSYVFSIYDDALYPGPNGLIFMLSCYLRIL